MDEFEDLKFGDVQTLNQAYDGGYISANTYANEFYRLTGQLLAMRMSRYDWERLAYLN